MKFVIRSLMVLIILVFIAGAGAFALLASFDANNYKDRISSAVKQTTGRDLVIAGDIKTTFFPVLGFEVSQVTLGNPAGFGSESFLEVGAAQVGVEFMPLLDKDIRVTKVVLDRPSVNVIKNKDGQTNLAFGKPSSDAGTSAGGDLNLSVGTIEISNAKVSYSDRATGKTVTIDPLNLTLPGYKPGQAADMTVGMTVKNGESTMEINGKALAKASPDTGAFELSNLNAAIGMSAPALKEPVQVKLKGNGSLNSKTQDIALNIPDLAVNWAGTDIKGKADIKGKLPSPLTTFEASASSVSLDNLLAGLKQDGTKNPDKPLLPVDLLRGLNLNGKIAIGTFLVNGLTINNVQATIGAKNGLINIAPMTADFYEGKANASLSIDAKGSTPAFTIKNTVTGVEIGHVLKAKMGDDYITGKANIEYDLNSTGNSIDAIKQASGGKFAFNFGEGYINKWQLSRLLNQAIAFFKTGAVAGDAPDKIYFTALNGTFTGQNGVFRNNDTVMTGPEVHALGAGTVSLAANMVDYKIKVGLGTEADVERKHLPIAITGPLSKPQYKLDTKAMVTDRVKEKLQDQIMKKLGGNESKEGAAAATEGAETTEPAAPSPEQDAAKKLIDGLFGK